MDIKIVKIFLGLSLVLWAVWGSLPRWFPLFSFFCWLVSSVSDFHPDTRGTVVAHFSFFRLTCSVAFWGGRDAANQWHWCVLAVSQPHWACPCTWHTLLRLYVGPPGTVWTPRLHAPPQSKPLRLGSQVALRGADSVGPAFCALPRTK